MILFVLNSYSVIPSGIRIIRFNVHFRRSTIVFYSLL